jgi:hypothetical protein
MPTNRKSKMVKTATKRTIERAYGLLKRNSGGKTFADEWAAHKREELQLEEAK